MYESEHVFLPKRDFISFHTPIQGSMKYFVDKKTHSASLEEELDSTVIVHEATKRLCLVGDDVKLENVLVLVYADALIYYLCIGHGF